MLLLYFPIHYSYFIPSLFLSFFRSDEDTRDVANMGSTFAAETNRRDEDAEM